MWYRDDRTGTWRGRAVVRLLVALSVPVLLGALLPAPADGHPLLERSTPEDGQTVLNTPHRIELWFSEPVRAVRVSLYDDRGATVLGRRGRRTVTRTVVDTGGTHVTLGALPRLPAAVYEVRWSVVSRADLHRVHGSVVFGVRVPGRHAPVVLEAGSPVEALYGWFDLLGTAALAGYLVLVTVLVPRARRRRDRAVGPAPAVPSAVTRLVLLLGLLSVAAAGLRLTTELTGALDPGAGAAARWRTLAGSGLLVPSAVRLVAVATLVVLLPRLTRTRTRTGAGRLGPPLAGVLAVDLVARADASHGTAGVVGTLVLASHQAAACVWLGGLCLVALTAATWRRFPGTALSLWSGFGVVAAVSVGVLSLTGLLLAGDRIASVDAALTTPYGRTLLVKTALVAAALGIGLWHSAGLHPWLLRRDGGAAVPAARAPRRGVLLEATLGATAALAAALLSASAPAQGPQFARAGAPVDHVTGQADGLLVTVSVRPNRPGRNLVTVDVTDSRRPAAGRVTGVTARLAGAGRIRMIPATVDRDGNGRWQGVADLGAGGHAATAVVTRPGFADAAVTGAVRVVDDAPRDVLVSDAPLRRPLEAGAVLVALAAALVVLVVRRRPRTALPTAPDGPPAEAATGRSLLDLEVVP